MTKPKVIKGIQLTFPNYPLFSEITKKLKSQAIYFQIEAQTCYLIRSGTEQLHRIKIGDLSNTKANNYAQWMKELGEKLKKILQESKARKQLLNAKFSQISDVELIEELEKRSKSQTIKLSMYAGNDFIHLEANDVQHGASIPFPIEVQAKGSSVKGGFDD